MPPTCLPARGGGPERPNNETGKARQFLEECLEAVREARNDPEAGPDEVADGRGIRRRHRENRTLERAGSTSRSPDRRAERTSSGLLEVRVRRITYLTREILSFELASLSGGRLPAWSPGAHIDVVTPAGCTRQYSLTSGSSDDRYVIAVLNEERGRGGSRSMHRDLRAGDVLRISEPRNSFPLIEDKHPVLLVGGGVGITPLLAMAGHLHRQDRNWHLLYCAKDRSSAAFLDRLEAFGDHVSVHLDADAGGLPDLAAVVAGRPKQGHLYCCGPSAMIEQFERATAGLDQDYVHVERFKPRAAPGPQGGEFVVELARSGVTLTVPPEKTILEVLLENGVEIASSCRVGVCGTCETPVIEGMPDHRDLVLTDDEKAAGDTMFVCCSRSAGHRLVLDL